jgi:hypothetical protein
MKDEIMAELWQIKDELAREAKFDVRTLCKELREWQAGSSAEIFDRSGYYAVPDSERDANLPRKA